MPANRDVYPVTASFEDGIGAIVITNPAPEVRAVLDAAIEYIGECEHSTDYNTGKLRRMSETLLDFCLYYANK